MDISETKYYHYFCAPYLSLASLSDRQVIPTLTQSVFKIRFFKLLIERIVDKTR